MVIPIHDTEGELIAYCGRWPSSNIPEDEAKYMLPKGFHKEVELFNLHRQKKPVETIILVESYFSAFKLHMLGYPVISPMGRSLSDAQIELLKEAGSKRIVLLLDGDDPGRAAVTIIGRQLLAAGFEASAPVMSEEFKPHRLEDNDLKQLITQC